MGKPAADGRFACSADTPRGNTVILTGFQDPVHLRQQIRRILQICVHHCRVIPPRIAKARKHSGLFAEISGEAEIADIRILLRQLPHDFHRFVLRTIIDQKDFKAAVRHLLLRLPDCLMEQPQRLLFVIAGYDNTDQITHFQSLFLIVCFSNESG